MQTNFFLSLLLVISIFGPSSFAKQYEISTQHSFVNFEVDYMKVSVVKGSFDDFQGGFQLDEKTNKVTALDFAIAANSINTRDLKRDKHLKEDDFFSIKKYPTIFFTGSMMKYQKGVLSEVSGSLELTGVIRPVTFSIDWKGFMDDPLDKGKRSLFLRAKTTIDRQDFGLNWNKSLDSGGWIVSDKVRIDVIIEASPSDSRPAFSRFLIKNKEIKNDPFQKMDESSLKSPKKSIQENSEGGGKSLPLEKKSELIQNSVNDSKGLKSYILLFVGFIIFLVLMIGGGFLKKGLLSFLEKHMNERAADLISDFVLYSVLLAAAIVSAPYMGYGDYFAK